MLEAIIRWSLGNRLIVILGAFGLLVIGILALRELPIDAFPDTTPVQVQVNTVAPALPPLEVERQLTTPIEQALSGLPELLEVRSLSRFGLSQVTLVFADGSDLWRARQVVAERLAAVSLPAAVARPELGPVATGLGEVFHYIMRGPDLMKVRTAHDVIVRPRLREVPGVAEVNAWGGEEREFQVLVDPVKLQARGITVGEVVAALESNNGNVAGPVLVIAGEATAVQGVALLTDEAEIARVVVRAEEGRAIHIGDIARVVSGPAIRNGAVTADGRGEVVLGLAFMMMGENSHAVTSRLERRLTAIAKSLPPDVSIEVAYERTTLVDEVLDTVRTNLLEGALLVMAILFAFLGSIRAGLIVALAIPLSMLFAFDLMLRAGIAGSLMSLGAIDFGMVVDSSVIMVENSVKRLAEDGAQRTRSEVVLAAALEVRRPTMFGELVIIAVYLPILFLEGVEGKLFRPMALTVVFALVGSLILSLTLMPVLASLFLPRRVRHQDNLLVRGLKAVYRPVLRAALRWKWAVLALALLALANAAFLATRLGAEFIPRLQEGAIVINTVRLASVSLDESVRYGTRLEALLLAEFPDEIERVWTRTGSAEVATDPMGVELSDVFITLRPRDVWKRATTQEGLMLEMQRELEVMPGMRASLMQPIEMRVNEMLAGIRSDIGVKVFGDDLALLKEKAKEVEAVLKAIPGSADVVTEQLTGQPLLQVVVDREAIGRHGIRADEVLQTIEALGATPAGEVQVGAQRYPLVVRMEERYREHAGALERLLVAADNGERVLLGRLAHIGVSEGPAVVNREWGKRRVVVQANVRERDIGSWVAQARQALNERVALPAGYYIEFGGQFEQLEDAEARLLVVVPAALLLVFLLLYLTYGRVADALRVFTGVPFAAIGGVVFLWLRDLPFSVSAAVGFIALSGVAVLGDMVLVSTIRQHVAAGMSIDEAVPKAAEARLRPVLMTALVAALGFLPMAFNEGIGAEVQRPLATVVIGGVITSTTLTLVVLPVLYLLMRRRAS